MPAAPDRLDIVLPFFGDPGLLFETVESVLGQSDERWRLIVVDDGHPDPRVFERLSAHPDTRLDYHRNPERLGANRNYRRGIDLVTASHFVVLGADDRLLPGYVSRVLELLDREDPPEVIQPGVRVIDQAGLPVRPLGDRIKGILRPSRSDTHLSGERAVTSLMHGNWTYFPSLVWDRQAVARVGLREFEVVQDLALLVDVLLDGGRLDIDDEVVFEYRRHRGSDSAVKSLSGERFGEEARYYESLQAALRQRGWRRASAAARVRWSSRAHALALLPLAARHRRSMRALLRHALTNGD